MSPRGWTTRSLPQCGHHADALRAEKAAFDALNAAREAEAAARAGQRCAMGSLTTRGWFTPRANGPRV